MHNHSEFAIIFPKEVYWYLDKEIQSLPQRVHDRKNVMFYLYIQIGFLFIALLYTLVYVIEDM